MPFQRIVGLIALCMATVAASPAPSGTPPPQIYRVVTTPFCARLHGQVRPAVALILQNDQAIAKSPALFKRYASGVFGAQSGAAGNFSNGAPAPDSIYATSPEASMALQKMSYLVTPIAQNVIAAQTLLAAVETTRTGNPDDDRRLEKIKGQLLESVAYQSASLDLINGFVATQQMGELQHVGQEYIGAISEPETTKKIIQQTPGPLQDPKAPGVTQNPYNVDLAAIPGLAVGYNPISRILDGMNWLQGETARRESAAASTITKALIECNR